MAVFVHSFVLDSILGAAAHKWKAIQDQMLWENKRGLVDEMFFVVGKGGGALVAFMLFTLLLRCYSVGYQGAFSPDAPNLNAVYE